VKETKFNPQMTQRNADKGLGEKEKKENLRASASSADNAVASSLPSPPGAPPPASDGAN